MNVKIVREFVCCVCKDETHVHITMTPKGAVRRDVSMDHYMLKKEVWAEAGFSPRDCAHLRCVPPRLGRELTIDDFSDAIINDAIRIAHRMGQLSVLQKF